MPRNFTDRFEQRKATRAKLINGALKLFSTSGYEHATVDDISEEAGYSKGAYYFHFSTKDDILLELLRMWTESRTTALAAAGDAGSPGRVRAMLEAFFDYKETPEWPGLLLEFWSQALRHEEVSKRLSQAYSSWRKELTSAYQSAAESGELSVESASDAAEIALAAHDGFAVHVAIGAPAGKGMTPARLAESLIAPLQTEVAATQSRAAAV